MLGNDTDGLINTVNTLLERGPGRWITGWGDESDR